MSNRISAIRLSFLRLGMLLVIAPFVMLMAFNHPFFDDYRNAYWTRDYGLWGMQTWFYQTWSGRFTSTFFSSVLNPLTYGWLEGVRPVSMAVFALLWASIAYFLRTVFSTTLQLACSWSTASWTAGLLLALFCNAAPSPFSFLYWFSGLIVYQLTLLSLLLFAALALRAGWGPHQHRWRYAGWACIPLMLTLAGGELTLVQALPVLAVLGYALPRAARPKWWLWLGVAGITTAIVLVSPGNWQRLTATTPPDPLHAYRWLMLVPRTAYSILLFLKQPILFLTLLAAAVTGLGLGFQMQPKGMAGVAVRFSRRHWWAIGLTFGALNTVGFLLFRYIFVGQPLMRARNEIFFLMLITVLVVAWLAAAQLPTLAKWAPRLRYWPLLLLAGLFGAGHTPDAWHELWSSARPFDAQMQARYAALRTAHRTGRPVGPLPPLRLATGSLLMPLRQFSNGKEIEFDIDLTPGCDGNINDVLEHYFEVPNVCCERDTALNEE